MPLPPLAVALTALLLGMSLALAVRLLVSRGAAVRAGRRAATAGRAADADRDAALAARDQALVERDQARAAQQRAELLADTAHSVLDALSEAVVLADLAGRVQQLNRSAQRLFPHLQVGQVPAPLQRVASPDGSTALPYTAQAGQGLRDIVFEVERAGGGSCWLSTNTALVRDPGGGLPRVLSSYSDVTQRERAVRELAQAHHAAVAADRAKSSFLAATSHEIRTPLNGVLGMTALLQATGLDDHQRELVASAQACGQQLLGLLSDVLDFSKADAGQLVLAPAPLEPRTLVQEVVMMVLGSARAKALAVRGEVDRDVPAWVRGDALRLRQALLNLASNAVKFTDSGEVVLRVEVDGDRLRLSVDDTGPGVSPDAVERLFQPFTQADASTTRRFGGTGLGLAIVREIAALHGGAAGAAPRSGGGSRFWFTALLPACAPDHARAPAPAVPPQRLAGHVLLAEDNAVNQRVAALMLEGLGVTVDVVADGSQAVAAALSRPYDLVLMDCQMPVMDGREATSALRARNVRVPVLALTASASAGDEQRCREAGMDGYLTKPVDPGDLARALARHLPAARAASCPL